METAQWLLQSTISATGLPPVTFIHDGDPAFIAATEIVYPEADSIICIWHLSQNLPKRLKSLLGTRWNAFIKDWYRARNSFTYAIFKSRYTKLIKDYPGPSNKVANYLKRQFGFHHSWAKYRQLQIFMAGLQSTGRVESYNSIVREKTKVSIVASLTGFIFVLTSLPSFTVSWVAL